jgi:hypothetical protein
VYGVKLTEDWRLLTADHAGHVRLWNSRDLVGARTPCLTSHPAFAPSIDDPASGLIDLEVGAAAFARGCCLLLLGGSGCCLFSTGGDTCWLAQEARHVAPLAPAALQGGPMRPVGMHCLDACLTHLAVAGRDSVVRLYSYE